MWNLALEDKSSALRSDAIIVGCEAAIKHQGPQSQGEHYKGEGGIQPGILKGCFCVDLVFAFGFCISGITPGKQVISSVSQAAETNCPRPKIRISRSVRFVKNPNSPHRSRRSINRDTSLVIISLHRDQQPMNEERRLCAIVFREYNTCVKFCAGGKSIVPHFL
jgi:hypothetical protein